MSGTSCRIARRTLCGAISPLRTNRRSGALGQGAGRFASEPVVIVDDMDGAVQHKEERARNLKLSNELLAWHHVQQLPTPPRHPSNTRQDLSISVSVSQGAIWHPDMASAGIQSTTPRPSTTSGVKPSGMGIGGGGRRRGA
eukprot:303803-Rhodomonas_salina.4